MIYNVRHKTRLAYAAPIAHAEFNLRLAPIDWPGQRLCGFDLAIAPQPRTRTEAPGPYPAQVTAISFAQPLTAIEVTSNFEIEVTQALPPGPGPDVETVRSQAILSRDMSNRSPVPYLFPSRIAVGAKAIDEWAIAAIPPSGAITEVVAALAGTIHRDFTYQPGMTTTSTPPAQAFAARKGVCQDFAHLMIIALRAVGLPAAYVSGYLRTLPPPGGEKLIGADAMHAWVAVWCGAELGWIGFDPTNDCLALDDHIVVAMGRDYADVAPIDGIFVGNTPQAMDVMVDVTAL